jgi:type I restriction enzyme S subunit
MTNGWQTVPLGKILNRVERFEVKDDLQMYHFAGTYSFARGIFAGEKKEGTTFRLDRIQRIRKGDFIYCKIMAWEGAFGIAPEETDGCVMSGAFVVYEIDRSKVDSKFIEYYFKQEPVWKTIGSQSTGTNVRRRSLHPDQFEKSTIPLPPLDEQRRIVARIQALADRIAAAQSLRIEANNDSERLFSSKAFQIFQNLAATYTPIPIGKTFTYRNDLIHPTDGQSGEIRFIGLQHIESNTGKRIGEDKLYAESLSGRKFIFSPGDIVYGYLRPYLNKVWIADCEGVCSVDQYVIQPKSKIIDTKYLWHFMRSPVFLEKAIELTHNLLLPRLRTGLLNSILTPVPPLAEQRRIVVYLDHLQTRVTALRTAQAETERQLNALLPSILDRAFKGQL